MPGVTLIAFGGPSSSGKTTAAKAVQSVLASAPTVHLDDFYLPDDQIPVDPKTGELNWDCPEAIDFTKFEAHIRALKTGASVPELHSIQPQVDRRLSDKELQALKLRASPIANTPVVLVDGFMLFHDPKLLELFDVKLFFHASFDTLRTRRESREGYNTVDGFWVDPPHYFSNIVWPAYAESHQYLFENGDLDGSVTENARQHLHFSDFNNADGTTIFALADWALSRILDHFEGR